MARWFFVTFLVACLVCAIQAFPQAPAAGAATPTTSSNIESALNTVADSLQKTFKEIMENPDINKLVQDGQKFVENTVNSIQNEAAKMMPKTGEK